jgi:chromosome segregation ATPase
MNKLVPSLFHSKEKTVKNKKIPIIEGMADEYNTQNEILKSNVEYLNCAEENQEECNKIKTILDDKKLLLDASEEKKNDSKIKYDECISTQKKCKTLLKSVEGKRKEFNNLFEKINELEKQINTCNNKKSECDKIDADVKELEKLITKYESDLAKLKKDANDNNCNK